MVTEAKIAVGLDNGAARIKTLVGLNCIPNDEKRDLCDVNIKRRMSPELRQLVDEIVLTLKLYGDDYRSRIALCLYCEKVDVNVNFQPIEKRGDEWISGRLMTKKGYIVYRYN